MNYLKKFYKIGLRLMFDLFCGKTTMRAARIARALPRTPKARLDENQVKT
jgi:hypothetical protein